MATNLLLQYDQTQKGWKRIKFIAGWSLATLLLGLIIGFSAAVLVPNLIMVPVAILGIIYLVCLWAMPDFNKSPSRIVTTSFLAYLLLTPLWPTYIAYQIPGFWISPQRLSQYCFTGTILYFLFTSKKFRSEINLVLSDNKAVKNFAIALVVIILISIPLSSRITFSVSVFAKAVMSMLLPFIFSLYYFRELDKFEKTFLALIYIGTTISLFGVFEYPLGHIIWMNWIPNKFFSDPAYIEMLHNPRLRNGIYRAQSTFTDSLLFAECLSLIVPFAMYFIIDGQNKVSRIISVFAYVIILAGLKVSGSRLGIVAFLETHALYLFLWSLRRVRVKRDYLVNSAVLTFYPLMVLMFIIALSASPRIQASIFGGHEATLSNDARKQQWSMGKDKIIKRPVGGYGFGESGLTLGFVNPNGVTTVDSYFLTLLLDLGIPGLIAFLGIFLFSIFEGVKVYVYNNSSQARFAAPLIVTLANFLVIKSVLSQIDNHIIAFSSLGMLLALVFVLKTNARHGSVK